MHEVLENKKNSADNILQKQQRIISIKNALCYFTPH